MCLGRASFGQFVKSISMTVVIDGDLGHGSAHPINQINGNKSTWNVTATQNASKRIFCSPSQSANLLQMEPHLNGVARQAGGQLESSGVGFGCKCTIYLD